MADRNLPPGSRSRAFRRDDWRSLAAELRREARAERPPFSPAVHEGVLAALAARNPRAAAPAIPRPRWPSARVGVAGSLAAAAACAAIAVVTARPRPALPPAVPAAVVAAAGIERLPTPEEIGASLLSQVATLAALAAGIPDLPDIDLLDPALLAVADPVWPGSEQAAGDP